MSVMTSLAGMQAAHVFSLFAHHLCADKKKSQCSLTTGRGDNIWDLQNDIVEVGFTDWKAGKPKRSNGKTAIGEILNRDSGI
jgi:hypothetical protein